MQLGLPFRRPSVSRDDVVTIAGRPIAVAFVRHRRARHYVLRVSADGSLRVTVPWGGSRAEARRFVEERREWVERERYARAVEAAKRRPWKAGTQIPFRGEEYALRVSDLDARQVRVSFATESLAVPIEHAENLRPWVERSMRRRATVELPEKLARLAMRHGFEIKAVSIRSQRSRWGSCAASGRISLNWRLIQFPERIVDYVLIHELTHLRHMNHSARFWREVERLCPSFREARAWLRTRQHADGEQLYPAARPAECRPSCFRHSARRQAERCSRHWFVRPCDLPLPGHR